MAEYRTHCKSALPLSSITQQTSGPLQARAFCQPPTTLLSLYLLHRQMSPMCRLNHSVASIGVVIPLFSCYLRVFGGTAIQCLTTLQHIHVVMSLMCQI